MTVCILPKLLELLLELLLSYSSYFQFGEKGALALKKFGAFSTIMLPMIFVVGLLAINEKVPNSDVDNLNSFWGLTAAFSVFTIVLFIQFRRWKWI